MYGHDDLHIQIAKASQAIKANPDKPELFLHRGGLYTQHEEYKKALKDFKKCRKLNYHSNELLYKEAILFYKKNKSKKAIDCLNEILANDPQDVAAWRLKGKVSLLNKNFEEAIFAFEQVIENTTKTIPENYFEAAHAWEQIETKSGNENAINVLEEGIQTLGPLLTFHKRLIEINRKDKHYEAVLYYQTKIIEQSNRKDRPYLERAKTYLEINNSEAAKVDLLTAKKAYNELNVRLKNQTINQKLLHAIEIELQKIEESENLK